MTWFPGNEQKLLWHAEYLEDMATSENISLDMAARASLLADAELVRAAVAQIARLEAKLAKQHKNNAMPAVKIKSPRWMNYALKEAERKFQNVAYGIERPPDPIPCGACAYWDDEATDREGTGSCRADGYGTETREDETPSWCPGAKLMELRADIYDGAQGALRDAIAEAEKIGRGE